MNVNYLNQVIGALMSLCMLLHIVILCFAYLGKMQGYTFNFWEKKFFFLHVCLSFSTFNWFWGDCEVPDFRSQNHGKYHLIPCVSLQVNELMLWRTKISILNYVRCLVPIFCIGRRGLYQMAVDSITPSAISNDT